MTVKEFSLEYYNFRKNFISETSWQAERNRLKVVYSYFSDRPIEELNENDIEDFIAYIYGKKWGYHYTKIIIGVTKGLFEFYCRRNKKYSIFPIGRYNLKKSNKKKSIVMSFEDFIRLMKVIDQQCETPFIEKFMYSLMYLCGLRFGEVFGLSRDSFDLEGKFISIDKTYNRSLNRIVSHAKTENSIRIIPYSSIIDSYIRHYLNHYKEEYIFFKRYSYTYTCVNRRRINYTKIGKLPDVRFHWHRKGYVTNAVSLGEDLSAISDNVGHKDKTLTLSVYNVTSMQSRFNVANKIEQSLVEFIRSKRKTK